MKDFKNELKYALDIIHEQTRFAETKNVSMIVFTSALFIGIISNLNNIRDFIIIEDSRFLVFNEIAYKFFIFAVLITLCISFIFSILAFFPKIKQDSIERFDRDKRNECPAQSELGLF